MSKNTSIIPSINCKDINNIKDNVNSILECFDNLGEETMICVVISKKNSDGTFTTHMGASSTQTLEHIKFHNGFIDGLDVVKK
jgi:hypothetical protein